mmetsp:Transcript_39733/g.88291  ORF Transcript_39733/g.88291 Transcript_39733/m.88291 type:complete len:200 (+) Transcript_39733:430-1029(+)
MHHPNWALLAYYVCRHNEVYECYPHSPSCSRRALCSVHTCSVHILNMRHSMDQLNSQVLPPASSISLHPSGPLHALHPSSTAALMTALAISTEGCLSCRACTKLPPACLVHLSPLPAASPPVCCGTDCQLPAPVRPAGSGLPPSHHTRPGSPSCRAAPASRCACAPPAAGSWWPPMWWHSPACWFDAQPAHAVHPPATP